MTQEDKQLLLVDLCSRLPYRVIVDYSYNAFDVHKGNYIKHGSKCILNCYLLDTFLSPRQNEKGEYIKPYLRPMSSMTEEEKKELNNVLEYQYYADDSCMCEASDWLNKKMFDYRGLIPKGLAEIAPEGMYELKCLPSQNESDSEIDNTTKITVGCKIRSKTNPDVILSIVSNDCHEDEFECSNGSVLSLKQIEKYYEVII